METAGTTRLRVASGTHRHAGLRTTGQGSSSGSRQEQRDTIAACDPRFFQQACI